MLRTIGKRGKLALLVSFVLSAFLLCNLPLHEHHPHAAESAAGNIPAGSAAPAATAPAMTAGEAGPDDQDHHSAPEPMCHATNGHVMDLPTRLAPTAPSELPGLAGALPIALLGTARFGAATRARRWEAVPPRPLSGFPLLLSLGVSRT